MPQQSGYPNVPHILLAELLDCPTRSLDGLDILKVVQERIYCIKYAANGQYSRIVAEANKTSLLVGRVCILFPSHLIANDICG